MATRRDIGKMIIKLAVMEAHWDWRKNGRRTLSSEERGLIGVGARMIQKKDIRVIGEWSKDLREKSSDAIEAEYRKIVYVLKQAMVGRVDPEPPDGKRWH